MEEVRGGLLLGQSRGLLCDPSQRDKQAPDHRELCLPVKAHVFSLEREMKRLPRGLCSGVNAYGF